MKSLLLVAFALTASLVSGAQPDCLQVIHFTNRVGDLGNGTQQLVQLGANPVIFNNINLGCSGWNFSYNSEGLSAISIVFQSAPNSYSSGASAGAFVTFAGTTITGSNPMTSTSGGTYTATGYYPWLQVNVTSYTGTGSVDVVLQGWRSIAQIGSITPTGVAGGDLKGNYPNPTVASTFGGVGNIGGCTGYGAGAGSSWQCAGLYAIYNGTTTTAIAVAPSTTGGTAHPKFGCIINSSSDLTCRWVANGVYAWTSGSTNAYDNTLDTGVSRDAAGKIDIGNGVQGDTSGVIQDAGDIRKGTKFTTSGCSVSSTTGGATAGQYTSGTTGTCAVTITMNGATGLTAPNGWVCTANDVTTIADVQHQTTPISATAATITGTTVSGDVITFHCTGY